MTVREITQTGIMAALICVLSPLSIPLSTQVPISLATLAVMLAGGILHEKNGTIAVLVYILLGMLGVPVFAGWSGGAQIVFGMTGGYIVGYLPLAHITGLFSSLSSQKSRAVRSAMIAAGALLGTAVLYIIGTAWFMFVTKMDLGASLAACVIPFIPGDLLKTAFVCVLVPRLESAVWMRTAHS
ncbi:MAG: biotin transporter BioY [Solobacterium sp.]|nr:biotin transporter BioY [Solobacterium sp.]